MRIVLFVLASFLAASANATTVVIANGTAQMALRVGATGGTISTVAFAPAAATAGNGTPVNGTTNAAAGAIQNPNFTTACAANNVRVWAMARSTAGAPRTATLQVNGSINLTSGANTIPLTNFDWVASGGTEIASAAFNGSGTQTLMTFGTSREVSVCLLFRYLNTTVYPGGTYTGQITYNLAMP